MAKIGVLCYDRNVNVVNTIHVVVLTVVFHVGNETIQLHKSVSYG